MKKTFYLDIIFILACACVFTFLHKKDLQTIMIAYQMIFMLIAYFFGKLVGKIEVRKKIENEDKNKNGKN